MCVRSLTMSLYRYFTKASKQSELPNPNGALSASVSPAAIKEANEAVRAWRVRERASREGVTLNSHQNRCASCDWKVRLFKWQPSSCSALFEATELRVEDNLRSDVEDKVPGRAHARIYLEEILKYDNLFWRVWGQLYENFPLYGIQDHLDSSHRWRTSC